MKVKPFQLIKQSANDFLEDRALRLAAALAYYALFSIGPLLILLVAIAGALLGDQLVRGQLHSTLINFLGPKSAEMVESMMTARQQGSGLITTIIGVVTLIFGASGVFGQLQDALNTIWEVKPKPGRGIMGFIRDRFLSMTMVLGLGFLLLISMVITTGLEAMTTGLGRAFPVPDFVVGALSLVVSFSIVTVLFAMIFKVLPDVKIRWGDVWFGAISTALLFTLGKFLLSLYLGREATTSSYGAAGSILVVMLWIYYASVILFFGAELTQVYAKARGHSLEPTENAVPVTEEQRAQEGLQPETSRPTKAKPSTTPGYRPAPGLAYAGVAPAAVQKISGSASSASHPKSKTSKLVSLAATASVGMFLFRFVRKGLWLRKQIKAAHRLTRPRYPI